VLVAFPAAHGAVLMAVYGAGLADVARAGLPGVAFEMRLKVGSAEGRRRWEEVFLPDRSGRRWRRAGSSATT